MSTPSTDPAPALLQAADLCFERAGRQVLGPLTFSVCAGLTWVCGGDGRGKTTLLRLMAARLQPSAGRLDCSWSSVFDESCTDPACDNTVAQSWLDGVQVRQSAWNAQRLAPLADAWGLAAHLHKPLYMLSTGSRRKVGLLAAVAAQAQLTLLDTPFAALDASSSRVLTQVLLDASQGRQGAWVVADYQRPSAFATPGRSPLIDLGD